MLAIRGLPSTLRMNKARPGHGLPKEHLFLLLEPPQNAMGITFPLERRSRWAEPGLKGETERRGGSSPYSSSRLGIWESPHLSLDLGESPHPVS